MLVIPPSIRDCLSLFAVVFVVGCGSDSYREQVEPHEGDTSTVGGSPTVRRPYYESEDEPETSNDESNDQPLGHFGSLTLFVTNLESGNSYDLDADLEGTTLQRLYFPRGGWVDFYDCELDNDYTGDCTDENGRSWLIEGE